MRKKGWLSFFISIRLGFAMGKTKNGSLSYFVSKFGLYTSMGGKNLLVELFHVYIQFVACYGETKMVH